MAPGGYGVDINALNETAQGINDTISALKDCGAITETAGVGLGFQDLNLSEEQVGYMDLTNAFGNFTSRWAWGVRALVQDGNQIAQRLSLNAGAYAAAESSVIGSLKDLGVAVDPLADPHETDQQAAAGGASQFTALFTGATTSEGKTTWGQAGSEIANQWETEAKDVAANGDKSPLLDPIGAPLINTYDAAKKHL
jgi:hypothetical protein